MQKRSMKFGRLLRYATSIVMIASILQGATYGLRGTRQIVNEFVGANRQNQQYPPGPYVPGPGGAPGTPDHFGFVTTNTDGGGPIGLTPWPGTLPAAENGRDNPDAFDPSYQTATPGGFLELNGNGLHVDHDIPVGSNPNVSNGNGNTMNPPKTGDETATAGWLALLAMAACLLRRVFVARSGGGFGAA